MRSKTLNNGGGYAATYSATSLTTVSQSASSEWAIYTMPSVKGSLTSFIEVPDNMSWQHNQSAKTSAGQTYDLNNDALDVGGGNSTGSYLSISGYKAWANDRLWLPSVAETGASGESGLWMTSVNQRANSDYTWTRSTYYNDYYGVYRILSNGNSIINRNASAYEATLRPAFHLNLKSAAARAGFSDITEPTNVSCEYIGKTLTIADVSNAQKAWYNSDSIDLTYPSGMIDVGTYRVKATVKPELQAEEVKFLGTPEADEDEYTRYFDFVITEKTLRADFNKTASPPTVKAVEEDLAEKDKSLADSILKIQYTDDKG
ncbi:MAG: hypothetical protein K2N32_00100, partial [Clostridia bacterium]|nr:hypothetical protein [Clostridia bacterium]